MKTEIENYKYGYGKRYRYHCDRCGREISYKENTLKQVHIKYSDRHSKKLCDLCERCYRSLYRGVFKKKEVTKDGIH